MRNDLQGLLDTEYKKTLIFCDSELNLFYMKINDAEATSREHV